MSLPGKALWVMSLELSLSTTAVSDHFTIIWFVMLVKSYRMEEKKKQNTTAVMAMTIFINADRIVLV